MNVKQHFLFYDAWSEERNVVSSLKSRLIRYPMDENKHILEEPSVSYGQKHKLSEIEFQPMSNMMETLRKQGYITHEEFVERLSKHL